MGDWFIGEIRLFAIGPNSIPKGWVPCAGQVLQITGYQALFSLMHNTYGGDGKTTFALPDLRGRVPIHFGNGPDARFNQGQKGGAETVVLTTANMPAHLHPAMCRPSNASGNSPKGALPSTSTKPANAPLSAPAAPGMYTSPAGPPDVKLLAIDPSSVGMSGGGAAHENRQPFLAMIYCIATTGIYPPRD